MYPTPIYTETDPAFVAAVMREHAFACLTSVTSEGLKATHAPLTLRAEEGPHGTLYGHLASDNPQCASFDGRHEAMAVFNGPHAYISPLWVREPLREVPTWDYISVQASGRPTALPSEDAVRLIGDLVETYEGRDGWKLAEMKASYRERLMLRVIPFRMPIETLLCVRKMHQGRPEEDRRLIAGQLRARGEEPAARAISLIADDHGR